MTQSATEKFGPSLPDWDTRMLEPPDLDNTLLVTGRYKKVYHLERDTGRDLGVHPSLASHWGLARVSDPRRFDSFGMGTYSRVSLGSSKAGQPVVVYRAPQPEKHLSRPTWVSPPEFSHRAYTRCIIPLRGSREAEDVFISVSDGKQHAARLWATGVRSEGPFQGGYGGGEATVVGNDFTLRASREACGRESSFVPYSAPIGEHIGAGDLSGAGAVHERLMCLLLGGDKLHAVDPTRAFEGAEQSSFLWEREDRGVEYLDTSCRFDGLLDTYLAGSNLTNVACSSEGVKVAFWDLKTGEVIEEIVVGAYWQLLNRFVPARQLWLLGTTHGFNIIDMRKMSEIAAEVKGMGGEGIESDFMRDVEDIGTDGRTFVSASQNTSCSLWTLDEALEVKVHWTRIMPQSNWAAKPVNKGRDGFLFGQRDDEDSEEFARVEFWLQLTQEKEGGGACQLSFSSSRSHAEPTRSIRSPRCFL